MTSHVHHQPGESGISTNGCGYGFRRPEPNPASRRRNSRAPVQRIDLRTGGQKNLLNVATDYSIMGSDRITEFALTISVNCRILVDRVLQLASPGPGSNWRPPVSPARSGSGAPPCGRRTQPPRWRTTRFGTVLRRPPPERTESIRRSMVYLRARLRPCSPAVSRSL